MPIYSQDISGWLSQIDITESYKRLQIFESFAPWIRAFCDLHAAINREESIRLVQPRVLDKLLLMTIRTEILLRSIYSSISDEEDPDFLKDVIGRIAGIINDSRGKTVLQTASGGDNWNLTQLRDRPDDIFNKIESRQVGRNWTNDQKYFFHSILKFVASRNYFAHHHYKDTELNNRANVLCREVLVACLHSVLYIDDLIEKGITKNSS